MTRTFACYVCLAAAAAAQQPPAFEVASIKPTNYQGGPLRVQGRVDPDGINFLNTTPRMCIERAYGIKSYQLTGPDWINTERYVIVAKAAGPTPEPQILQMLQTLLAERFKLVLHRETRELPVYALVVAKTGFKLKEVADDGATEVGSGDGPELTFERAPLSMLASVLGRNLDRPVFDETGLKGRYTFQLDWAERSRKKAAPESGVASDPAAPPSVFTALPERLGLKLEPRKQPVEMLVIDHVEKPSAN